MIERSGLIDRLFKLKHKPEPMPNCYGFAFSLVADLPEKYRDPEKIWKDYDFMGIIPNKEDMWNTKFPEKLPILEDISKAEIIAVLDVYSGPTEVIHVMVNRPDKEGYVLQRPNYNRPAERILLKEVMRRYSGMMLVGFNSRKQKEFKI